MATNPRKPTALKGITASALARATEQALHQALQRACELLSKNDLKASELNPLLKTLDSIRFSLRWQDKVLSRAEKAITGSLSPHIHPKVAKDVGDRLKAEETRLRALGKSTALREFDKDLGITPGKEDDEEVA